MIRMTRKKMGAWILIFCVIAGSIWLPSGEAKAGKGNLALLAQTEASDTESGTQASDATDGNKSTRWASNQNTGPITMNLSWEEEQTIKSFSILWERRTVQNFNIEISSDGNNWTSIFSRNQYAPALEEIIVLDEAQTGSKIRLTMSDILATDPDDITSGWASASIYELEIYEEAITDISEIAAKITAPVIEGNKISMPESDVASVRFCADYEQIIGEDGTIYQPLATKTVKGFYEVKDTVRDSSVKTEEYTITVPGKYTEESGANEKPDVIPELQEWHGLTGDFLACNSSKIVAGSEELLDVANVFAKDYKEITGTEISAVSGSLADVSAGDFYMALSEDEKGLGKEGYTLSIGNYVVTEAEDAVGAYWATRTILQILKQTNGSIPKGLIRDYPKYEVRAFSLDVGRKGFTLDALYQYAKNMSWYKMNNFQVHLSDNLIFMEDYKNQQTGTDEEKLQKGLQAAKDQAYAGFRLESGVENTGETYPELKGETATSKDLYYTKDEFRQFIKDSRVIGVEIIPELDMPAHALPFTRAFPEYRTKSETGGSHAYTIDELDLENPATTEFAKNIWRDYFTGDDPVFDKDTVIHIGTDEYHGTNSKDPAEIQKGKEAFRKFSDDMIKFVQGEGRTVRMWGSLSNKEGTTPVTSKDVQLNIWSTAYANSSNMFNQGFDLINTLVDGSTSCGGLYIVPSGSGNRGSYGDFLNRQNLYDNWQPNVFSGFYIPAGNDQMLGACFAAWHDNIDTRAAGISQYDSFYRFMDSLPVISAKVWGDVDKEETDFTTFQAFADQVGTAPDTNMYAEVDFATNTAADWTFDEELKSDSSVNANNLTKVVNAEQVNGVDGKALQLNGGESYVETPLNQMGSDSVITMKVRMDADADEESSQILCESKDVFGTYGTYAFKASITKNGTSYVGFSREGYDYTFNYTLPKNEWVELSFHGGQDQVALYVNGQRVGNNPTCYEANHPEVSRGNGKVATMMVPIGRIGSNTDSFKGQIEYVKVTGSKEITGEMVTSNDLQNEISRYGDSAVSAYTDISWNAFSKALDEAKKVVAHTDSSEQDYTYAYEKLKDAALNLKDKPAGYDQEIESIRTVSNELSQAMKQAEEYLKNSDKYSEETVNQLKNALSAAKEVLLENPNAKAEELSSVLQALKDIKIDGDVNNTEKEQKSEELKSAIAAAEALLQNTAGYTKESVEALQKAINEAKAVIQNPNSSVSQLEAALSVLRSLKLVNDSGNNGGNNTNNNGLQDSDTFTVKGSRYQIVSASEKTVKIVKGKDAKSVTIDTVSYNNVKYTVVEIADNAFKNCKKKLKTVTVGAGVKVIGKNAFKGCKKLTTVKVKNKSKLTKVGKGAFKSTSKKIRIQLPKNLKKNKRVKNQIKRAGIKKGL